ncbi:hypothetical protein Tco_1459543 [Tanacetum coccineum]
MLEDIRLMTMERMQKMREKHEKWNDGICPNIRKKFEIIKDLHSCRAWQLSGIPCQHGCAAIYFLHKDPEDYISDWGLVLTSGSSVRGGKTTRGGGSASGSQSARGGQGSRGGSQGSRGGSQGSRGSSQGSRGGSQGGGSQGSAQDFAQGSAICGLLQVLVVVKGLLVVFKGLKCSKELMVKQLGKEEGVMDQNQVLILMRAVRSGCMVGSHSCGQGEVVVAGGAGVKCLGWELCSETGGWGGGGLRGPNDGRIVGEGGGSWMRRGGEGSELGTVLSNLAGKQFCDGDGVVEISVASMTSILTSVQRSIVEVSSGKRIRCLAAAENSA